MGILIKLIIILGLVFLIAGMFTKSKKQRVERRNRTTNILLIVIIVMLAISIVTGFINR